MANYKKAIYIKHFFRSISCAPESNNDTEHGIRWWVRH